ncbi:hypothetical protein BHE74_00043920 [Ensete ventricosum]|nr:hypothetical protein GW17_00035616 [Ensete ventricosum]RWW49861.1 hypothetical protein BHE74_00043920 [Ensete ventricosum]
MTGAIELQPDKRPRSSLGIGPGSDDAVGPRREFARRFVEGIGKLTGNMLGDYQRKTIGLAAKMPEAVGLSGRLNMIGAMELQPNDGPKSSLSIGPGFGRCSGISPKFVRTFAEGIGKLAENMSGDYQKKTIGLTTRISKATGLAGVRS